VDPDPVDSPLTGKPLPQRLRNFRPDAESAVRALGGPLAWMRRLRGIEDALDQHERQLGEAYRVTDPADWPRVVRSWDFSEINVLIESHNRNFPAEARLRMDPRTRDFVRVNGRSYEREPLDAEWILSRWPAERP
jgi:hypothetical protein